MLTMRRSHYIALGLLIASAALSQGCAQILGDFDMAAGAGGASSSSVSSVGPSGPSGPAGSTAGVTAGNGTGSVTPTTTGTSSSATAGGGGQGQGGSSSSGGVLCGPGTTGAIQDNFDDNLPEPQWAAYSASPLHVAAQGINGKIKITTDGFVVSGTNESFAGYKSTGALVSLEGCELIAQVGNVNINGNMAVRMELINDSDPLAIKTLRISIVGTNLIFHDYENGNGNGTDLNQLKLTYDPVAHAWWRFHELGGTVFFDTAPDGKSWVNRHSLVTPAFAKALRVNLTMGSKLSMTAAGSVTFDNVNTPPP
jgi:hypothetical protein